jgi:transketolase
MNVTVTSPGPDINSLREIADRVRGRIIDLCGGAEGGHLGGSLSAVDILTVLYFQVLRVSPQDADHADRDIFLLSKGHAALALYAVLAERGFLPVAELASFGATGSRLAGHPVRAVPGVEMPTGSLGHGLGLGLGFALAARLAGQARRTFVLTGDGELQEGSCWEAAGCAAAQRTDTLTAIVDANGLQLGGATADLGAPGSLADRWRAFGWSVRECDGHDQAAVADTLAGVPWQPGQPSALIAHTQKGYGVGFIAGQVASHFATLSERQHSRARAALAAHLRRQS